MTADAFIRAAETDTETADRRYAHETGKRRFAREVTPTERHLLTERGYRLPKRQLLVVVDVVSPHRYHRRLPRLGVEL